LISERWCLSGLRKQSTNLLGQPTSAQQQFDRTNVSSYSKNFCRFSCGKRLRHGDGASLPLDDLCPDNRTDAAAQSHNDELDRIGRTNPFRDPDAKNGADTTA
jgi:hypothetical protein